MCKRSNKNEKIFAAPAAKLTEYQGDPLSVVCAYNENSVSRLETHGIPDEEFIRGKAPMTKEEVRTVSLSKLKLTEDSICYDVGAGTGSVSVEAARKAFDGTVYAIEEKADALDLIRENKRKFRTPNVISVYGKAPQAMDPLPAPTHAFIGGSRGNLKEILERLLEKNPDIRVVLNAVTLETAGEALRCIKEQAWSEPEIVQVQISRGRRAGAVHLMEG